MKTKFLTKKKLLSLDEKRDSLINLEKIFFVLGVSVALLIGLGFFTNFPTILDKSLFISLFTDTIVLLFLNNKIAYYDLKIAEHNIFNKNEDNQNQETKNSIYKEGNVDKESKEFFFTQHK